MNYFDQKMSAWGGIFCCVFFGVGLFVAGFVPPPSPSLSAQEIALIYQTNTNLIRLGMVLSLFGIVGYAALVGVISAQLNRISGVTRLPVYLQLGAGSIGVLTVMFPVMIFGVAAFRPERDPAITQMLNDVGWLIIIPAFPTFIAQLLAVAFGVLQDKSVHPIFPRWTAFFNIWISILFIPGGLAYFFKTGPFAWNGIFSFWVAAGAFFVWLLVMTRLTLVAIKNETKLGKL